MPSFGRYEVEAQLVSWLRVGVPKIRYLLIHVASLLVLLLTTGSCAPGGHGNSSLSPGADTVAIVDDRAVVGAFHPATLSVHVGEPVQWINTTATLHDVVFTQGSIIASPVLGPGAHFSVTFSTAGVYRYVCDLHVGMEGTVLVVARP